MVIGLYNIQRLGDILVSWVYKSHEELRLGRHSETPQNFSYYIIPC